MNKQAAALRTLDEIWEAGAAAGAAMPPLTQAQADRVAAILAAWERRLAAAGHMNSFQLAERLGVTPEAVRKWRQEGRGPAYIRGESNGDKATIRYRVVDVEAWEESRIVRPGM